MLPCRREAVLGLEPPPQLVEALEGVLASQGLTLGEVHAPPVLHWFGKCVILITHTCSWLLAVSPTEGIVDSARLSVTTIP